MTLLQSHSRLAAHVISLGQDADDHAEQAMAEPAANGVESEPQEAPAAQQPSTHGGPWFLPPPSAAGNHVPEVSQLDLMRVLPTGMATV